MPIPSKSAAYPKAAQAFGSAVEIGKTVFGPSQERLANPNEVGCVRTVGVEEEFLLLSRTRSETRPRGDEVVERTERASTEPASAAHELMQEQAETGTEPCHNPGELNAQRRHLRGSVDEGARSSGVRILAVGASPLAGKLTTTPDPRYRRLERMFALVARQQLTCGQHVHVSVASREEGVAVLDRSGPWLPVVPALAANSPYGHGADAGYASYRSILWNQRPTAGPTAPFGDVPTDDRTVEQLIASGAAIDTGMVYFDARLAATYPTVEIRVADVCTDLDDAVVVALLCRARVDSAACWWAEGDAPRTRLKLLRAAAWAAARWGLSGPLLDPATGRALPAAEVLPSLLDVVAPALAASGDGSFAREHVERLQSEGNGAQRQRHAFRARRLIDDVVDDAAARTLQWR